MVTSDAKLQGQVLRELNRDSEVPNSQISVQVDHGIVILRGTLEHGAQRAAAEGAAHRVAGVREVLNNIVVRYPVGLVHSDAHVAMLVRSELDRRHELAADEIHATVSAGWVRLTGSVKGADERREAEGVVRTIEGVRGVTDDLRIQAPTGAFAAV